MYTMDLYEARAEDLESKQRRRYKVTDEKKKFFSSPGERDVSKWIENYRTASKTYNMFIVE